MCIYSIYMLYYIIYMHTINTMCVCVYMEEVWKALNRGWHQTYCVTQAGLKFTVLLFLPLKFLNCRFVSPYVALKPHNIYFTFIEPLNLDYPSFKY